ncbi:MAG: hypothetical protein LC714_07120 [Actinobacteria bacterium]|nr:hypothetical protein [Actinomycetota bacterium]
MAASADIPGVSEAAVSILVDYESPLARSVAGDIWSGLSRAALEAGHTRITALWESIRETEGMGVAKDPLAYIFAVGQDRPDAVDAVKAVGDPASPRLYGVVVAVPDRPSPLTGSLLYQGVQRLTDSGVKAGMVEPALLHAVPEECERYARRLLERLRGAYRIA